METPMTIEIITPYTNGIKYRTWTFDPETCTFQQTSPITARGKRPPEMNDFVENGPTSKDVQQHMMMLRKMCVQCGNSTSSKYCLRRWCSLEEYAFVPERGYFKHSEVIWNPSSFQYDLIKNYKNLKN